MRPRRGQPRGRPRSPPPPLLPPQPRRDHVGGDRERPHAGPAGDPGVQLQQGQQAPGPHHAAAHRGRGRPFRGGDAGEAPRPALPDPRPGDPVPGPRATHANRRAPLALASPPSPIPHRSCTRSGAGSREPRFCIAPTAAPRLPGSLAPPSRHHHPSTPLSLPAGAPQELLRNHTFVLPSLSSAARDQLSPFSGLGGAPSTPASPARAQFLPGAPFLGCLLRSEPGAPKSLRGRVRAGGDLGDQQ